MVLKVYNSLTNKLENFEPIQARKVSMYVCGPTVYNYIHVGNARSVVAFDTIRRYFEYLGYDVNYVSNFTDVDDKMIKAVAEQGITVSELADKFIKAYFEDTKALNVEPATKNPRATDNIADIIAFVSDLIDKGYAYSVDGNVYYRARKFKTYGELGHEDLDTLESGASQHVSKEELKQKEDPIDFALWKAAKSGEISWDSPWGKGRPGWHIECSVMSTKYLGDNFDIHGGGIDLEFPHHENERAQSEAKTGEKFVNYWLHNGFVTVGDDDEKMSKSLGNFVTVHDLLQKVDPEVLRFMMSTTQYRRPVHFSQAGINEAATNLNKIQTAYRNLDYRLQDADADNDPKVDQEVRQIQADFQDAMDDDFNVQNGITEVYELAKLGNVYSERPVVFADTIKLIMQRLQQLTSIFGVDLKIGSFNDQEVENLIEERNQARADKNFARSDEIRDELKEQGIILEDTPQGTRFRRENKV
ncbi:cysteine--tRNA ligase [Fructilactobacillus lindneri]|uniref:Cysteine--tRNA ligase n=2 Tax=Fructilactobacillus lindneri TaxID=53444 RepID=A0A0R2JQE6_9LACO|nr:cysteine--tRNA ligase [Fructilactobacillus lindneri]ANZ57304.1 cysteine--tRNA ligase [Fructilactobacillus lindneri]ANZ58569.1 cysteine--tRNA ligase [Fructilactobacillus lindneri]KRN79339.1 cysteinyl-tRNA synthetase [Fructilactobacillus lindneri DSM 20690 = JCM 11027]POG98390.1 cysteine--tRNA ligase [Fructilactobacillus lindneri]POH03789.1 cysteine--tRNA ligase [Fructilactobacillus lindneri]